MTFIITLIALVIERFFDWGHVRRWRWFANYQAWLGQRFAKWPVMLVLVASLLLPVLAVALINALLAGWLFGVLKLVFGALVVVYCLGPHNFWAEVYTCISEFRHDDQQAAMEKVQQLFHVAFPSDPQAFHRAFTNALFIEANRRVFAVLFWFICAGPSAALLYRLIECCKLNTRFAETANKLQRWLDWLPVRAMTLLFALGGHFVSVTKHWKQHFFAAPALNDTLLTESGVAALDILEANRLPEDGSAEQETLALFDRVFVIALVILAIVVLM